MKIALFGVDGTILDSTRFDDNLGSMYLLNRGITPKENLNDELYPLSLYDRARYLKYYYHLDEDVDDIYEVLFQYKSDFYEKEVQLKDGIINVLDILKRNDYRLYIISACLPEWIGPSFERLGIVDYFNGVFLEDDLRINKTSRYFYLEVKNRLGVKAKDYWVFDDSWVNVLAASHVGMKAVGIYDVSNRDQILKSSCDIYLKTWRDFDEMSFVNYKKEK
ncbi:MAG: HAD family hydrolase [Erysipelotrichaceae bacterium]|nr:HAD family hydrolase [Erysipelotrichaceae bacterium]